MSSWLFFTLAIQAVFVLDCTEGIPNECSMKADPGFCMAYFPRFYYDVVNKRCEQFIYGGCQGNKNNFLTLKECERKCINLPAIKDCPQICTFEFRPVCGSNGKTYANKCTLKVADCKNDERITIRHSGLCDPCADIFCEFRGKCKEENGVAKCHCSKACTFLYDPVCGHDGTEYSNLCVLQLAECEKQKEIKYDKGSCRWH